MASTFDAWLATALLLFSCFTVYYRNYRRSASSPDTLSTRARGRVEKVGREPGEWTPIDFDYPVIEQCIEELDDVKPIPYRPFRWGAFHVTMGIRDMPWNEWSELDNQFVEFFRIREHRIKTRGDRVVKTLPATNGVDAGYPAALELVYEMAEYLSRRYPKVYTVVRHTADDTMKPYGWYNQGRIQKITIVPVDVTYNLDEENPMKVAALLTQDDIAILIEGSDGRYYLQAGAICVGGSWRLEDNAGMSLDEIHYRGHVPQYESKLHKSMSRFFQRMPVDKPVVRNNYSFQVVNPPPIASTAFEGLPGDLDPKQLAWAHTMHGNEDPAGRKDIVSMDSPQVLNSSLEVTPRTLYMRSERQTLRRLPRTGAIIFGIRTYMTSIEELASEPSIPGRLASALRSWPDDVASYKGRPKYDQILDYLDQCHADQINGGIIDEKGTDSKYPF